MLAIWKKIWFADIRILQACLMGTLLLVGVFIQDFSIYFWQIFATFLAGLLTQWLWMQFLGLEKNSIFSGVITCLGLSLLLRSDSFWVHPVIAVLVLSSKFLIQIDRKHIFNPALLGVIIGVKFFPGAWISPGQWGDEILVSCFLLLFGLVVSRRANIQDISMAFIGTYVGLLGLRTIHYGYEWEVFLHQISNGSLILFTFFMITDPRTAPNHRVARILHGISVALFAHIWQFVYFKPAGIVWALFYLAPVVPLWDKILKDKYFQWKNVNRGRNDEKQILFNNSTDTSTPSFTV